MTKPKASYQQIGGKSILLLAHDAETAKRLAAFCTELGKKLQTTNTNAQTLAKLREGMVFSSTSITAVWRTWRRQSVGGLYYAKLDALKKEFGNNIRRKWKNSKHSFLSFMRTHIKREKELFLAAFVKDDSLTQKNIPLPAVKLKSHIVNYRDGQVFTYANHG